MNFLEQVQLGHAIIASLWDTTHPGRPNYYRPLLEMWEPCDEADIAVRFSGQEAFGDKVRYLRARSMYFAALAKAGFEMPDNLHLDLHLNQTIRRELARSKHLRAAANFKGRDGRQARASHALFEDQTSAKVVPTRYLDEVVDDEDDQPPGSTEELSDTQPVNVAISVYRRLFEMTADKNLSHLFGTSKDSGKPYFEDIHMSLLRILGDASVSGTQYLIPFRQYHALDGSHVTRDIVKLVDDGKTVIVDLSNSDEEVARYYSKLITTAVLKTQVGKFSRQAFGDHSVLFYFEEAHNLFERDDKNLRSVYNRLAKEGAKYRIGLVYATQSMTTLSPDLLKNTENLFIAHLNDDREIHELVRHFEFRDVGPDVQRTRTQGYVRMITLSHRFALPVQIEKFGPANASKPAVSRSESGLH